MAKRIDPKTLPEQVGTLYPTPFDKPCRARGRTKLGDAAGLTQYGVNLLRLPPGCWSSQRHWHNSQDEFIYILSGEVVLVTNGGEEILKPGDCAGFKAGDKNGHHLQNRGNAEVLLLEMGTRVADDSGEYSDIDMVFDMARKSMYQHKDGAPYPDAGRRGPDDP
jgi:uncharacterized cupin superfamily protein